MEIGETWMWWFILTQLFFHIVSNARVTPVLPSTNAKNLTICTSSCTQACHRFVSNIKSITSEHP